MSILHVTAVHRYNSLLARLVFWRKPRNRQCAITLGYTVHYRYPKNKISPARQAVLRAGVNLPAAVLGQRKHSQLRQSVSCAERAQAQ